MIFYYLFIYAYVKAFYDAFYGKRTKNKKNPVNFKNWFSSLSRHV